MMGALLLVGQKGLSDTVTLTFEPRPAVSETNPTAQLISTGPVRSAESRERSNVSTRGAANQVPLAVP